MPRRRILAASALAALLTLGLAAPAAQAAAQPCRAITTGTVASGARAGWIWAKNVSAGTVIIMVHDAGQNYPQITSPGSTYYFENRNVSFTCCNLGFCS